MIFLTFRPDFRPILIFHTLPYDLNRDRHAGLSYEAENTLNTLQFRIFSCGERPQSPRSFTQSFSLGEGLMSGFPDDKGPSTLGFLFSAAVV